MNHNDERDYAEEAANGELLREARDEAYREFDATDSSTYPHTVSIDSQPPAQFHAADVAEQAERQASMDRHPAGRGRTEICNECGAEVPSTGSMISSAHEPYCSLHPDNVVPLVQTHPPRWR